MTLHRLVLVAVLSGACSGSPVAVSRSATVDARVQTALDSGARVSVLVYLRASANLAPAAEGASKEQRAKAVYRTLVDQASRSQQPVLDVLAASGHTRYQAFHIVNALLVRDATAALVQALADLAEVSAVVLDQEVRLRLPSVSEAVQETAPVPAERGKIEPNLVAAGADQVWSRFGVNGKGVVVAGQDTGVDWTHPALKPHYRGWDGTTADHRYNWHDAVHGSGGNACGYDTAAPCDDHGHGSHTIGTVVGDDGGENRIGMAPGAQWIACRNMDEGAGKPSTYIECFEWFLAPYPQGGDPRKDGDPSKAPDVVNNSWGCDESEGCSGREILPAIAALKAAGVVIVASAGNDGPSCGTLSTQPATAADDVISVGAYDHRSGKIASFSSRGPSTLDGKPGPHVSAPGVSIRSSVPGGNYEGGGWSGTSMAGPHVVGEVALLLSADPTLRGKPDQVMDIVRKTASGKTSSQTCGGVSGSAIPNNTFGFGTIDALGAVSGRMPTP